MAFKVNSRDYIEEEYNQDSLDPVEYTPGCNYNFYLIYDPIIETEEEVLGGPWCFSIEGKRAYIAFTTANLARQFVDLWSSSKGHEVIKIKDIGTEFYQELLDDVGYLLLLNSLDDIENLIKDVDKFPYEYYLIPREKYLVH